MSEKPWNVRCAYSWEASFETLSDAESFAKRSVRICGNPREIWHGGGNGPAPTTFGGLHVASVRRDAYGRMWVDVLDSALA